MGFNNLMARLFQLHPRNHKTLAWHSSKSLANHPKWAGGSNRDWFHPPVDGQRDSPIASTACPGAPLCQIIPPPPTTPDSSNNPKAEQDLESSESRVHLSQMNKYTVTIRNVCLGKLLGDKVWKRILILSLMCNGRDLNHSICRCFMQRALRCSRRNHFFLSSVSVNLRQMLFFVIIVVDLQDAR